MQYSSLNNIFVSFCLIAGGCEYVARLPAGSRITDYISLGVVAKTFPLHKIHHAALAATGSERVRQRDLSAHVARLLRHRAGAVQAVFLSVQPDSHKLSVDRALRDHRWGFPYCTDPKTSTSRLAEWAASVGHSEKERSAGQKCQPMVQVTVSAGTPPNSSLSSLGAAPSLFLCPGMYVQESRRSHWLHRLRSP